MLVRETLQSKKKSRTKDIQEPSWGSEQDNGHGARGGIPGSEAFLEGGEGM